ncbi:DUF1592 domain-containing protein [Rubripirellula reticaptiva]|uniref:Planctomycete cytochrome C n=1 Tax=Rubripirellula reticaptiva TaxID=2528013 RepID=A0A5C6EGW0_9BACT|nr:DUF1592 domain-containing protein [Rubripirellula reticaptiva]TWU46951.1 hypothetical protein Poly59_59250 [Rubripirellula reticaptiva]
MFLTRFTATVLIGLFVGISKADDAMQFAFRDTVEPMLRSNCLSCHNDETAEGDLDLSADTDTAAVVKNFRRWSLVLERLQAGDMPPEGAELYPDDAERNAVIDWIEQVKDAEAKRTSGDPGIVLARRLSSSEYNYTIRDLTGADIRPAESFPVDPANEAGFDNSGESLAMSPALLKKYLEAARKVSEHMALTPSGLEFAPHAVITDTDRDKFCVNRIIDFYRRQNIDYADYFFVLWKFKNRVALGQGDVSLSEMAVGDGLSTRYCETLWELLSEPIVENAVGPIATLKLLFNELPETTDPDDRPTARLGCQAIATFLSNLRTSLVPDVANLTAPQINNGSQPLVLWKNKQFVANRRRYVEGNLPDDTFGLAVGSSAAKAFRVSDNTDQVAYTKSLERFCDLFPDQFFVSERARVYLDKKSEKKLTGRYLSAGFHSQMGYFRDDAPLYDLMLDDSEKRELDRLWLELDFVASAPMRQYAGFIWFDRTDSQFMRDRVFDRYRAEDKDCISADKVAGLSDAYCDKAKRVGASDEALQAIRTYFTDMSKTFRRLESLSAEAGPVQLAAVVQFAERAFRRPLSKGEADSIRSFYHAMRDDDGLSHEDAIRDSVVSVLMSPHFCYRIDLPDETENKTDVGDAAVRPLGDYALASRLSYFLWSSMPDDALLDLAKQGRLHDPDMMVQQMRRMLDDDRASGFMIEFAGNWLDFRRFTEHNGVDRNRFPTFTDELRQAMSDEPLHFLSDLIARDGSVLECLYADHTFVNQVLADHYGMTESVEPTDLFKESDQDWVRIDQADRFGRGGLLPMAVFLTNNSPGLRTSPVKRGNWLIKRMLGEQVPAPPATVPELPADESQLGELTLRETLARHRQDVACAGCHNRIDSMGLVFEGYGPVGELREQDLGGRLIDDSAVFPDDTAGRGLNGLRDYIRQEREDDFVDNLCRKLLAFGLGRTLQLSDEMTIEMMKDRLAANDYRISSMMEVIVTSPAFLNKRVRIPLQASVVNP